MRDPIDPKDKRAIEKEIGYNLSELMTLALIHVDGDYRIIELRNMCKERGLVVSGGKKKLIFSLLNDEISKIQEGVIK